MFDLLFYLKELVSGMAIAFCAFTFCMSLRSDRKMLEAAKITWSFLGECLIEYIVDERKKKKFFTYLAELSGEIDTIIQSVVGDTRFAELCKLEQPANREPLKTIDPHLGMTCIKVSVYYADTNEKQRLENLLTNVVVKYLSLSQCDTRVLVDWTMRNDLAMPVLRLHFALTREQQKNLDKELASLSKKIIAKNTSVIDDTEEVDLF